MADPRKQTATPVAVARKMKQNYALILTLIGDVDSVMWFA